MSTQVTLTLSAELYEQARRWAALTQRELSQTLTDALVTVLTPIYTTPALEKSASLLTDEDVLSLCQIQMAPVIGQRLSALLEKQQEGMLHDDERSELLALMQNYNQLWIRQSEALAEAVRRGLRQPLEP